MMNGFPRSMTDLIKAFSKMPGIGVKTAERLAFYLLKNTSEEASKMAEAILKVKSQIRFCSVCNNLSDMDICHICNDGTRDRSIITVVEKPNDIVSIEKMGRYRGVYHVLLGALSPLDGVGPKDLRISQLIDRTDREDIKEVILATDSSTEGEATSIYISKLLRGKKLRVTRIASGIPVGANLQYADQATLLRAFEGRIAV